MGSVPGFGIAVQGLELLGAGFGQGCRACGGLKGKAYFTNNQGETKVKLYSSY